MAYRRYHRNLFLFTGGLLILLLGLFQTAFSQGDDRKKRKDEEFLADSKEASPSGRKALSSPDSVRYKVWYIPELSSEKEDFAPSLVERDGRPFLYFSSSRKTDEEKERFREEGKKDQNIYRAAKKNGEWERPKLLDRPVNSQHNEGGAIFDPVRDVLYFTRCPIGDEEPLGCDLLRAKRKKGGWHAVGRLLKKKKTRERTVNEGHPAVGFGGKVVVFASDRKGTHGELDLWMVRFKEKKQEWSEPVNLGAEINTSGTEGFPFIRKDGTLFFSSNGRGEGEDFDIFRAEKQGVHYGSDVSWETVEPLGKPFNSDSHDLGITFNEEMTAGYFASNRSPTKEGEDLYGFRLGDEEEKPEASLRGDFTYMKGTRKPSRGMRVQALDENGEVVATTETRKNGAFFFWDLPSDQDHTIRLKPPPDSQVKLTLYKGDGNPRVLLSNANGAFVYRQLQSRQVSSLSMIDEEDVNLKKNTGVISGQMIHDNKSETLPNGLQVKLVNEKGEVIRKTVTGEHGNFTFEELPLDKNLLMSLQDQDQVTALIYNREGQVKLQLKPDENGKFLFKRIHPEAEKRFKTMDVIGDPRDGHDPLTETIRGRLDIGRKEQEEGGKKQVHVLGFDGESVYHAEVDSGGYFRMTGLPIKDSMVFKVIGMDPSILAGRKVMVEGREGEVLARPRIDDQARFVYHFSRKGKELPGVEADIEEVLDRGERPKVYYGVDAYRIHPSSAKMLRQVVKKMKADPGLSLIVHSYTDSQGDEAYNKKLARQRSEGIIEYLVRKGIARDRLQGIGHGEKNLVNDCTDNVECPDAKHQLNRRTEFEIREN